MWDRPPPLPPSAAGGPLDPPAGDCAATADAAGVGVLSPFSVPPAVDIASAPPSGDEPFGAAAVATAVAGGDAGLES